MSNFDPTPAVLKKLRDGSLILEFGNVDHGFHNQFDFYGLEKVGERIVEAVNQYGKHRALIETMVKALDECEEHFDSRADAEYFTDRAAPVPNEEMRLLVTVRDALNAAREHTA